MITIEDLNPNLLSAEYAVRGPIVERAQELERQGRKITYCNIGNPLAFAQKPLTFIRQILSLLEYPELLSRPEILRTYPRDVVERAKSILQRHPHGTGAYTQSPGIPFIREAVAEFIRKRDGIPSDKNHIILTDGASKGVQAVLLALLRSAGDGFMIPIPQYPLYSATITLYGGRQIGYMLDEAHHWQLDEQILSDSLAQARRTGTRPVAIAVINPGNPTGAVLTRENIHMIIGFAGKHRLAIIADEVYQENVYEKSKRFFSFARCMHELGETGIPLFSLHSVSKGFLGECGHRGGYVEFRNIPDPVMGEFIKLQSISLCANVSGQMATYLMVSPPVPGDESFETYVRERDSILRAFSEKAQLLGREINNIEGMSLEIPEGALYAFVRFSLPPEKGVDVGSMSPAERSAYDAKRDTDYCMALLEETGMCVVPGSGFGQEPGTLHFRTTFLPAREELEGLLASLKTFHENYVHELAAV